MRDNPANLIESYLLAAKGWVSAEDLCKAFKVSKRDLRAHGHRPGLCSRFAISGNKGFRHVTRCTPDEFAQACQRMTSHAEGELGRVRLLRAKRTAALQSAARPAPIFDGNSDQTLLLSLP